MDKIPKVMMLIAIVAIAMTILPVIQPLEAYHLSEDEDTSYLEEDEDTGCVCNTCPSDADLSSSLRSGPEITNIGIPQCAGVS